MHVSTSKRPETGTAEIKRAQHVIVTGTIGAISTLRQLVAGQAAGRRSETT
ncbi:MAG: hypothetical protein IT537_23935 [Hyphomicrobiales bacterium]|nr:hypothetical protein [Hyphomicrobiales bacterium]